MTDLNAENVTKILKNIADYYPKQSEVLRSINLCNLKNTKIVIIGQDPYHNKGQANGLAFSVPNKIEAPPSLKNIFKEVENCTGSKNRNTDLSRWASQGVLLLNSILTVEKNKPESHKNIGWEKITDDYISKISKEKENIVFMLWGNYAKQKESMINKTKHLILKTSHPSPLSAYRGFLGSSHFSKANKYLISKNINPIEW